MFFYLHMFTEWFSPLRVFQYITVRTVCAAGTSFVLCLVLGPWLIRRLRRLEIGQQVRREEAPPLYELHGHKAGTPTMGGIMIIMAMTGSSFLWAVPNFYVLVALATLVFLGGVGFLDDFLKIRRRDSRGLGGRCKLAAQSAWAVAVALALWYNPDTHERLRQLMVPFFKEPLILQMSLPAALIFLWLVVVGASNAVNLTDGLDGLAIGCSNAVAMAYLVMAYVAGHYVFAGYLQVPYVAGAGELTVICGALLGAGMGFLWYNCHPAGIFMGDTGSLALGGTIAVVAILIKQELVLVLVGGVFVIEALSVLLQVAHFKITGGRRLFRCAPLHHHFEYLEKERAEKAGRDLQVVETMITTRFWIVSAIFALIGLLSLKLR